MLSNSSNSTDERSSGPKAFGKNLSSVKCDRSSRLIVKTLSLMVLTRPLNPIHCHSKRFKACAANLVKWFFFNNEDQNHYVER